LTGSNTANSRQPKQSEHNNDLKKRKDTIWKTIHRWNKNAICSVFLFKFFRHSQHVAAPKICTSC